MVDDILDALALALFWVAGWGWLLLLDAFLL